MRGRGCGRTAGPAASRTTCRHLRPMRGDASKDAVAPSSRQLPVGNRLVTRGRGRGRGTEMCGDAPGGLSLMDTTGLRCARDISHWFITGLRWCRSARSRGRGGGCCPSRVGCPEGSGSSRPRPGRRPLGATGSLCHAIGLHPLTLSRHLGRVMISPLQCSDTTLGFATVFGRGVRWVPMPLLDQSCKYLSALPNEANRPPLCDATPAYS